MSTALILGLVGALLMLAFLANRVFRVTRVPDVLVLMALGLVLGPVLGFVDPAHLSSTTNVLGALAIVLVLTFLGLPFIVHLHHGNPAIMAAMGMLAGYCGTLLTPLAATFNVVPVLLLELKDKYAVIKAQAPMALIIFGANLALMYFCVYRF